MVDYILLHQALVFEILKYTSSACFEFRITATGNLSTCNRE
uniref:Uncharacterized protein n=1 Tax=Arundo donax TaxID=35708 RepID=A0A0A9A6U7_ARUDO